MQDTIMDRFTKKQTEIDQRRAEISAHYSALWSQMIAEWKTPDPEDRVWLTYSANYLFRTNNVHWAIDPLTMHSMVKSIPRLDLARDLSDLSLVLLTHGHKDHLDLQLLSALRHLSITWVVPEFILSKVIGQAGLPHEKIIVPVPLHPIELNGIYILPFDGLHWELTSNGSPRGVPALGYLIECNGKRWLFPGDTRTYNVSQLPVLDSIDVLFAHLWLGRGSALMDEPPLLDAFCRFFVDLSPPRLILTHLNEFGREANDFWDETHIQMVSSKFQELSADILVSHLLMGGTSIL